MKIPISISPFFWVTAAFIGWLSTSSFMGTVIWMGIIFVSVLFHEYGHALTSLYFGQKPRIELTVFGGTTTSSSPRLKLWKEFIVVFNGPLFGFLLFLLGTFLIQFAFFQTPPIFSILNVFRLINLFWALVNLLPVMPMDGGQLLRISLEGIWGIKGWKYALFTSMIIAFTLCLLAFLFNQIFMGALFFLFAFQNLETWRRMRFASESDRSENLQKEFEALQHSSSGETVSKLKAFRKKAKQGMIFNQATALLAKLEFQQGHIEEAYDYLKAVQNDLDPPSLLLLHQAAFELKDYSLALQLAGECFQYSPSAEMACRNALASAALSDVESTIGWLHTAIKEGVQNLDAILAEKEFDSLRHTAEFQKFLKETPF